MARTNGGSASAGAAQLHLESHPPLGDKLIYAGNELRIVGIALATAAVVDIRIEVDDVTVHAARGMPTPWAPSAFGDAPMAERAGFEARLDLSHLSAGRRPICLVVQDDHGEELTLEGEIDVEPFAPPAYTSEDNLARLAEGAPAMWCESPWLDGSARVEMPVRVEGWAWAAEGVDRVTVTVDHAARIHAAHGMLRPHLRKELGEQVATEGGFAVTLDPSECGPGEHVLTVVARDRAGRAVGLTGSLVVLAEPPPVDPEPEVDITSERYVPELHVGYSFEPEHHARYRWAAPLAAGRTVLDAACGSGFGSEILARSGAASVTGFDASMDAVRHAKESAGELATFVVGDLLQAPFPDERFDLVTCFEAIEHVEDPFRALDELRRVLAPGGVLLVSTPNRGVYAEGNPHHLHELTSEEFKTALTERFAHVRVLRQQSHVASLLASRETAGTTDSGVPLDIDVRIAAAPPEEDLYVVGAASDEPLPPLRDVLMLGRAIDLAASMEAAQAGEERALLAEAQAAADRAIAATAMAGQERALGERNAARAERELADSSRQAALAAAEQEATTLRAERDLAIEQLDGIRRSRWWRAGAPLRWLQQRRRGA